MTAPRSAVRDVTSADLDWVVGLAGNRRARLRPNAPRFWNPAADAWQRHREFLAALIADDGVLSIRTEHGYLLAMASGGRWLVDDMVVSPVSYWSTEGENLLRRALGRCGTLRFVSPVFEIERAAAAAAVGLVPVEQWWHRDLADAPVGASVADVASDVSVSGATGRLVPAPPIYDPGGPVLLVMVVDTPGALTNIELAAARRGAGCRSCR